MAVGFGTMLTGGWQLFWARTAGSDWPAVLEIRIGAAVLLASIALAVATYGFRSPVKAKDPEL